MFPLTNSLARLQKTPVPEPRVKPGGPGGCESKILDLQVLRLGRCELSQREFSCSTA